MICLLFSAYMVLTPLSAVAEDRAMSYQLLECSILFDFSKDLNIKGELSEEESYVFDLVITGFYQKALEYAEQEGQKQPVIYIEEQDEIVRKIWTKKFADFHEPPVESFLKSLIRPSTYAFKTLKDTRDIRNKIEDCGTLGGTMRLIPH